MSLSVCCNYKIYGMYVYLLQISTSCSIFLGIFSNHKYISWPQFTSSSTTPNTSILSLLLNPLLFSLSLNYALKKTHLPPSSTPPYIYNHPFPSSYITIFTFSSSLYNFILVCFYFLSLTTLFYPTSG